MENFNHHVICFIKTFVAKERQERFLALAQSKKKRNKLRLLLAHKLELNPSRIISIKKDDDKKETIYKILKEKGSPDYCYIICESSEYDNKEMELKDAINELYSMDLGYIISCVPGKLAYYQGEDACNKAILIN